MKSLQTKKIIKILTDLKFALAVLLAIAIASSLGSFTVTLSILRDSIFEDFVVGLLIAFLSMDQVF